MSDSLWPHGLQHTRLPCPSLFLPEFAQTHVGDAIQPSYPRLPPSSLALNLSQHQGHFKWVCSLHQVTKLLELQFQISPSSEYLGLISFRIVWFNLLNVQGSFRIFSSSTIWKHQFFRFLYGLTLTSMHDYWKRQISHITYTWKQTNKKKMLQMNLLIPTAVELGFQYVLWPWPERNLSFTHPDSWLRTFL